METVPVLPSYAAAGMPWSFSKAGVAAQCALQYDFKYGAARKTYTEDKSTFTESRIGSAVHKALELALNGVSIAKAFQVAIESAELAHDEAETTLSFVDNVTAFVKRTAAFRAKYGIKPLDVFLEYRIGMSTDFKSIPFFDNSGLFRGVLDLVMLTPYGDAVVIDHKSGKQKEMSEYEAQCRAYCILILARHPQITGVKTGVSFLLTGDLQWNPRVSAETIRAEYHPWLLKFLTESSAGLQLPPTPNKTRLCGWCGYKALCPEFQLPK